MDKCKAYVDARGRGNYGFHRCTKDAKVNGFCTIHYKADKNAAATLIAYSSQSKYQRETSASAPVTPAKS